MKDHLAHKETEALMERLVRVENALFCLREKSKCFASWDNSEVERLESLQKELRARCERLCQQGARIAS